METEVSENLRNIRELATFCSRLNSCLTEIKDEEYTKFANLLEQKATARFQRFMKNNVIAKNLKIKVEKTLNYKKQYDFKIKVVNQYGENQEQPGGADQALRKVAVVFGLLDITENKRGYPFIADAPISKLSPDTKTAFFKSVLEDNALSQCIILNMDLWSSEKQEINEIGQDVLKLIKDVSYSRFITITPTSGNQGVGINYLKH